MNSANQNSLFKSIFGLVPPLEVANHLKRRHLKVHHGHPPQASVLSVPDATAMLLSRAKAAIYELEDSGGCQVEMVFQVRTPDGQVARVQYQDGQFVPVPLPAADTPG